MTRCPAARAPPVTERPGSSSPGCAATGASWLRADLLAGLTTAAVVVPKAMAYATVAGLPAAGRPLHRLRPGGGLRRWWAGRASSASAPPPPSPSSPRRPSARSPPAPPRAGCSPPPPPSRCWSGSCWSAAGLLRLGFVANFISEPVLAGFKAAIGLVIVVDQLPKLLGLHLEKAGFLRDLVALAGKLGETSLPTLAVAAATAALILGMKRWLPALPAAALRGGARHRRHGAARPRRPRRQDHRGALRRAADAGHCPTSVSWPRSGRRPWASP